ncbi:hypothetical protein AABB24_022240 [Solanum stoloniferum]|uniref:K-box domain-containing protein n=1 Tax=Solanum stoloniferum TaxID=62892 RepID=A0ABD2SZ17_9SOLN
MISTSYTKLIHFFCCDKILCVKESVVLNCTSKSSGICLLKGNLFIVEISCIYQFCSITKTLERYQRCCLNPQDNCGERETQSWYQEVSKLKAKFEALQRTQRHLLGEDLGALSVKELQSLEKQLEGALAQARQRKTQIMMEQMEELRRKERHLGDVNKQLKIKVSLELSSFEGEGQGGVRGVPFPWSCNASLDEAGSSTFHFHHSQSNQMDYDLPDPVLQIGYHQYMAADGASGSRSMAVESNIIHGWGL